MERTDLTRLETAAREAARRAYCPYSRFPVGAAALAESGAIHTGCNVENASYGLSMCAERTAVFAAVSGGNSCLTLLVIYTPTAEPTAPCGACRQVIAEFAPAGRVVCICDGPNRLDFSIADLLPCGFGPGALG